MTPSRRRTGFCLFFRTPRGMLRPPEASQSVGGQERACYSLGLTLTQLFMSQHATKISRKDTSCRHVVESGVRGTYRHSPLSAALTSSCISTIDARLQKSAPSSLTLPAMIYHHCSVPTATTKQTFVTFILYFVIFFWTHGCHAVMFTLPSCTATFWTGPR